jgi:hypothetical protein
MHASIFRSRHSVLPWIHMALNATVFVEYGQCWWYIIVLSMQLPPDLIDGTLIIPGVCYKIGHVETRSQSSEVDTNTSM